MALYIKCVREKKGVTEMIIRMGKNGFLKARMDNLRPSVIAEQQLPLCLTAIRVIGTEIQQYLESHHYSETNSSWRGTPLFTKCFISCKQCKIGDGVAHNQ